MRLAYLQQSRSPTQSPVFVCGTASCSSYPSCPSCHSGNGIRTRVLALRGLCPRPLDDTAAWTTSKFSFGCPSVFLLPPFPPYRPGGNRTPNRRFWRPVLYQLSYGPRRSETPSRRRPQVPHLKNAVGRASGTFTITGWLTGIEPATPGATDRCSNQLSYSHHLRFCAPAGVLQSVGT